MFNVSYIILYSHTNTVMHFLSQTCHTLLSFDHSVMVWSLLVNVQNIHKLNSQQNLKLTFVYNPIIQKQFGGKGQCNVVEVMGASLKYNFFYWQEFLPLLLHFATCILKCLSPFFNTRPKAFLNLPRQSIFSRVFFKAVFLVVFIRLSP